MQVEFLVIHSFPFVVLAGSRSPRVAAGLYACYVLVAFSLGLAGGVSFLALTASTYLGFFLERDERGARPRLAARWVFAAVAFLAAADLGKMPEDVDKWRHSGDPQHTAGLYFTAIALAEALGLFKGKWIEELADQAQSKD